MNGPIRIRVRHRISQTRKKFLLPWKIVKERLLQWVLMERSCIRPYIDNYIGGYALRSTLENDKDSQILMFQWLLIFAIEIANNQASDASIHTFKFSLNF